MNATAIALAAFPELRGLADLREAGWSFLPKTDSDGELVEVRGVRTWPGSGSADAILVRYATDAAGVRSDDDGLLVWRREGSLTEVVDALIALPPPGAPYAPRLVLGSAPSLWLP